MRQLAAQIILKMSMLFIFCILLQPGRLSAQAAREYTLKAVYLEAFSRHVEWPDSLFSKNSQTPFVIGVIGENPFAGELENTYKNHKILNHPVKIQYLKKIDLSQPLHMLFVARSYRYRIPSILEITRSKPILTIAEFKGAANQGVHINLFITGTNLQFEVNQKAVEASGLKMSFHLLQRAVIVGR